MKAIIIAEIGSNWQGSVNKAKKINQAIRLKDIY